MLEVLSTINDVFEIAFHVFLFILFYQSLKKCFLKEGESKGKLFFLSLVTNPLLVFAIMVIATGGMMFAVIALQKGISLKDFSVVGYFNAVVNDADLSSALVLIAIIIFILVIISISYLVGKRLKAYNKSLVTFVYLMFSVIVIVYDDRSSMISADTGGLISFLSNISNIVYFSGLLLLYFFIMHALARLSDKTRSINWKLFLIPPIAFSLIYGVFDFYTYAYCSEDANVVVQILSFVILILFIWAFYVIIKNIKATNDAQESKEEVKTLSVEVMEALAHTIDAKDEYTRGHSVRVAKYSRMLAERLGLSSEDSENVYYMALLHDIGKIGVPNEIINNPSKLTDEEYTVIKTHPGVGSEILAEIKSRPDLVVGARWHHERYDGKGYPDGKKGEDIPFFARIIAVADSYDAMTSNRSYRKYLPQDKVRSEIENNAGTQFDPKVAKTMLELMDEDKDYTMHE